MCFNVMRKDQPSNKKNNKREIATSSNALRLSTHSPDRHTPFGNWLITWTIKVPFHIIFAAGGLLTKKKDRRRGPDEHPCCQGGMECDSKPRSISLAIAGPENNVLFTVDGGLTDTLRASGRNCLSGRSRSICIGRYELGEAGPDRTAAALLQLSAKST
jgi:hypothetical protein